MLPNLSIQLKEHLSLTFSLQSTPWLNFPLVQVCIHDILIFCLFAFYFGDVSLLSMILASLGKELFSWKRENCLSISALIFSISDGYYHLFFTSVRWWHIFPSFMNMRWMDCLLLNSSCIPRINSTWSWVCFDYY